MGTSSGVRFRGQSRPWRHILLVAMVYLVSACGGGGGGGSGSPTPHTGGGQAPVTPSLTRINSETDGFRFLVWSSFGPRPAEALGLVGTDAAAWLRVQFAQPPTRYLAPLVDRQAGGEVLRPSAHTDLFWNAAVGAPDQLRQRTVFALSQIMVVSDRDLGFAEQLPMAMYMDILSRNAFGNYRDILEEVTFTPAMGDFLTYLRNRKADRTTGRMPDENFARELMQLFTIGLVELQPDGRPRLGADGQFIETFTNDDVSGLARVFTGMSLKGSFWVSSGGDAFYSPLVIYPEHHEQGEKSFLGLIIPAGTSGPESVDRALDHLFNHPNMGPFLAKQLIQRLTQSHPEPSYVARVATAFDRGQYTADNGQAFGTGRRGDMQAVLAAILLEPTLWNANAGQAVEDGKIREPVLLLTAWARAFNAAPVNAANEARLADTGDLTRDLAQDPFGAPSVFNFYRPGYIAPGSRTADAGLTAPELQIIHEGSVTGVDNTLHRFATVTTGKIDPRTVSFEPDYSRAVAIADDPVRLVDELGKLLTGGRLLPESRQRIIEAATELTIRPGTREADRLDRVKLVVLMIVTSPSYFVVY